MKFLNFHDIVVIAVFAYAFVWLTNKGLIKVGLANYLAKPAASAAS